MTDTDDWAGMPGLKADWEWLRSNLSSDRKFVLTHRKTGLGDVLFAIGHAWKYCQVKDRTLIIDLADSRYVEGDHELNAASVLFDFPDELEGVPILVPERISWNLRQLLMEPTWLRNLFIKRPKVYLKLRRLFKLLKINTLKFKGNGILSEQEEKEFLADHQDSEQQVLTCVTCRFEREDELSSFFSAVKPHQAIANDIGAFVAEHPSFIAIHVRYYDPSWVQFRHGDVWHDFDQAIEDIEQRLALAKERVGDVPIFLATNGKRVQEALLARRSDILIVEKDFGLREDKEMHDVEGNRTENLGAAAILDMFLLGEAAALVRYPPTNSWFSKIAAVRVPVVIEH